MKYERFFKKVLKEDDQGINVSPAAQEAPELSDSDVWKQRNPEIAGNEDLGSKFDVQGLDKPSIEKYSETIQKWSEGIGAAIDQLKEMIKFAAGEKIQGAPGSDQFGDLIKQAPQLKRDLSGFKSQIEDLAETVKLAIHDAELERKEKIKSLKD